MQLFPTCVAMRHTGIVVGMSAVGTALLQSVPPFDVDGACHVDGAASKSSRLPSKSLFLLINATATSITHTPDVLAEMGIC